MTPNMMTGENTIIHSNNLNMEILLERLRNCESTRAIKGYYFCSFYETNERYIEMLKEKIRQIILNEL
jgi:hypothetical protein